MWQPECAGVLQVGSYPGGYKYTKRSGYRACLWHALCITASLLPQHGASAACSCRADSGPAKQTCLPMCPCIPPSSLPPPLPPVVPLNTTFYYIRLVRFHVSAARSLGMYCWGMGLVESGGKEGQLKLDSQDCLQWNPYPAPLHGTLVGLRQQLQPGQLCAHNPSTPATSSDGCLVLLLLLQSFADTSGCAISNQQNLHPAHWCDEQGVLPRLRPSSAGAVHLGHLCW